MRRLVLLGAAKSTRELIPAGEVEIWSLLQNYKWLKEAARWYEIHDVSAWGDIDNVISAVKGKVVTAEAKSDKEEKYPLGAIQDHFKTRYFCSSFDYMMANAIYEHQTGNTIDKIFVVGFNFHGEDEYERQMPSASYWIGRAEGVGIEVVLQAQSAMKKNYQSFGDFAKAGFDRLYAYGDHPELDILHEKMAMLENEKNKAVEQLKGIQQQLAIGNATKIEAEKELCKVEGALAAIKDTRALLVRGGA